jgi:hypothetical protein
MANSAHHDAFHNVLPECNAPPRLVGVRFAKRIDGSRKNIGFWPEATGDGRRIALAARIGDRMLNRRQGGSEYG